MHQAQIARARLLQTTLHLFPYNTFFNSYLYYSKPKLLFVIPRKAPLPLWLFPFFVTNAKQSHRKQHRRKHEQKHDFACRRAFINGKRTQHQRCNIYPHRKPTLPRHRGPPPPKPFAFEPQMVWIVSDIVHVLSK